MENNKKNRNEEISKFTFNLSVIAALFAMVVSILLLVNYWQLSTNTPIESTSLEALVNTFDNDDSNEVLKQEIRQFDLMARKAYFTAKWQIVTGGWLLLFAGILLVVSLRIYHVYNSKIEKPNTDQITMYASRIMSQRWLLGFGLLVIILAISSSFASTNYLDFYKEEVAISDENESGIQMVDLTSANTDEEEAVTERDEKKEEVTTTEETVKVVEEEKVEAKTEIKAEETKTEKVVQPVEKKPTPLPEKTYPNLADINKQYSSFRGPLGNGVSNTKGIPTSWNKDSGENIKWKATIPHAGYSSPVIWGDKLFLTGANATERWVYCYHSKTGELLWQQQADNIPGSPAKPPKTTEDTGLAAPTVVTDGSHVLAIFGTGDIIAFDMNGKRIWAKNLGVPSNHYGHSSSLMAWKEKVIVQYDTNKGGRLLTLNIETGDVIWDVKRKHGISWASPVLAEIDGKMQIITSAEPLVIGHDLETGAEVWKVDCMLGEVGPSVAYANGLVIASNEYATLAAINPTTSEIVWQDDEYLPEVASPVVSEGLLFIATSYGVFACYDVHSGNKYWETEYGEGFYASPIIADGKVFAIDMGGDVHIFKVDRELNEISTVKMGEQLTTSPAFAEGHIYIRGNKTLYCIGAK